SPITIIVTSLLCLRALLLETTIWTRARVIPYTPPQKLRGALQRLVKALISAIAEARDRRLASATYDVRAELAEMQDIDHWCPKDDITGARIVPDIALMLALTQALPTSLALACLLESFLRSIRALTVSTEWLRGLRVITITRHVSTCWRDYGPDLPH